MPDRPPPGEATQATGDHGVPPRSTVLSLAMMDRYRRWQGSLMDAAGYGPVETPHRVIHEEPGLRVRAYGGPGGGPAMLIVPAPIKRSYIWDLSPERSVVRRCLEGGFQVFLAEWLDPGPAEQDFGLADYADRMLGAAADAVRTAAGRAELAVAGHSLGGTFAAIFAALHGRSVSHLVLLEAPLGFGERSGAFEPLVATAPPTEPLGAAFGAVPGSFINLVSVRASPATFQWERWLDRLRSVGHRQRFRTHMQVERWTLDEFPLPGRLFADVVERLYREDLFMRGRLEIGGLRAGPAEISAPVFCVMDPASEIIPPASILPFFEAQAHPGKRLFAYAGDTGVSLQHVGVLVGRNAHATLWPAILEWLGEPLPALVGNKA